MDPAQLAEIREDSKFDFVDLQLTLLDYRDQSDGTQRLMAKGLYKGQTVGFGVTLGPTWGRQDLEDDEIWLYWGHAELTSLGEMSNDFVRAVDELYGTNTGSSRMLDRVPYVAVSLSGDPPRLEQSVKLKLFFESGTEDRDAEFFLNLDPQNRTVQFHEKDVEYRRGVVLSLSESPSG
jgi:hypothetical protein